MKFKINKRKLKFGSFATALTIGVIAIVILLNVVFSVLISRFPQLNIDFTKNSLYQFNDETKDLLSKLDKDITITVLNDEALYSPKYAEFLRRYAAMSPRITLKYINIEKNPSYRITHQDDSKIAQNSVVVECEQTKRHKTITEDEFSSENNILFMGEYKVSSAILFTTQEKVRKIGLISGHGERYTENFISFLSDSGFAEISQFDITTNGIEADKYDYLAISAPLADYSVKEVKMIDDFLSNKTMYQKNLLMFYSSDTPALPNLEALFAAWGIKVNSDILVDQTKSQPGIPTLVFGNYASDDFGAAAKNNKFNVLIGQSRTLEMLIEEKGGYKTTPIISTFDTAYKKEFLTYKDVNQLVKTDKDKTGSFYTAAIAEKMRYEGQEDLTSHIFVSGSIDVVSQILTTSNFGNAQIMSDVVKYMNNEKDALTMTGKTDEIVYMSIDTNQIILISVIIIGIIPLIILAVGIIIWLRRRHL